VLDREDGRQRFRASPDVGELVNGDSPAPAAAAARQWQRHHSGSVRPHFRARDQPHLIDVDSYASWSGPASRALRHPSSALSHCLLPLFCYLVSVTTCYLLPVTCYHLLLPVTTVSRLLPPSTTYH